MMWKRPKHPPDEWRVFFISFAVSIIVYALIFPVSLYLDKGTLLDYGLWKNLFFFLANFLYIAAVPLISVSLLSLIRPIQAAGGSIGFAIFCVGYAIWAWRGDSLVWIGYAFSMPGGVIACLAILFLPKNFPVTVAFAFSLLAVSTASYLTFLLTF